MMRTAIFLAFLLLSSSVNLERIVLQDYEDPTVRVSTGVYLQHAPQGSIIYSQTTPIIFTVQLGHHKIQNFHSEALVDFCNDNPQSVFHPLCLIRSTLRQNLDNAADKLETIFKAMTGLAEYPRYPDVRFRTHGKPAEEPEDRFERVQSLNISTTSPSVPMSTNSPVTQSSTTLSTTSTTTSTTPSTTSTSTTAPSFGEDDYESNVITTHT